MADRMSAAIFAEIFEMLAANPTEEHRVMAKNIWKMKIGCGFSNYQMHCDDALMILDLATKGEDVIFYLNNAGTSYE